MATTAGEMPSEEQSVNTITINPPAFCESSVRGWFTVVEAQFEVNGITESHAKFYNVMSALPPNLVANIPGTVLERKDYEELKNLVFEQTRPELLEKLSQKTVMTGCQSLWPQEIVKPPTFCESSAIGWFVVLEAQFHLKGITKTNTKFYTALSALPPNLVTNIPSEVLEREDYEELKNKVCEQTKPKMFEKLLQKTTVTGRPSLYLQELQSLARSAGIGECQGFIRHKFLSSLPHTISPAIAAQTTLPFTQLGSLADELLLIHNNYCNTTQNQSSPKPSMGHRNSRSHSFVLPMGLRPFYADQKSKICRAHIYFADKARSCKPWCKYPSNSNCKMEPSSRPTSPAPFENSTGRLN